MKGEGMTRVMMARLITWTKIVPLILYHFSQNIFSLRILPQAPVGRGKHLYIISPGPYHDFIIVSVTYVLLKIIQLCLFQTSSFKGEMLEL